MERNPIKLSYWLAQGHKISKSSDLRDLRDHKFRPCKVSVAQKLNPAYPVVRINFCHWMLQSVHDRNVNPMPLSISDDAWVHPCRFFERPDYTSLGHQKSLRSS
jgi:hypothetical protein